MQDIRKKYSNSKSNFPVAREIHTRGDSTISHIGLSGEETRRPRYTRSDDISVYKTAREEREYDENTDEEDGSRYVSRNKKNDEGRTWRKVKAILSFGSFVVLFFGLYYTLTYVFDKATITITPNYRDITLTASPITLSKEGAVTYETVSSEATKTKSLPKTTTTTVDKKASGEIIISNTFSATPQRLVKFTRFESSTGKIYKIAESIVIPGKTASAPGNITVKVTAESEGADYNTPSETFSIPGFKGKDQFTLITAKTSSAIVGGSSGSKTIVALTDLNAAKDELALALRETLRKDFASKTFDKKIPALDSLTVKIEDNAAEVLRGETDTYSAKGTGYIALIDESSFSKVALTGDVNKNLSYHFTPSKNFTIQLDEDTPLLASSTLHATVIGNARVTWATDYEKVKDNLISKPKNTFTSLISDDKTISSATLSLFPPWKGAFPSRKTALIVKEKLPEYKE